MAATEEPEIEVPQDVAQPENQGEGEGGVEPHVDPSATVQKGAGADAEPRLEQGRPTTSRTMDVLTQSGIQTIDPNQVPGYSAPVMPGNVIEESDNPSDVIHNRPNIRTPGPQYYPPEIQNVPAAEATGQLGGQQPESVPIQTSNRSGQPLQAGEPVTIEPAQEKPI